MHTHKQFLTFIFAVTLATLVGCAGGESRKSTGEVIDDAAITTKVKTALIRDDTLSAFDINVETYKGTVQLSGFVESDEDVERAEEVASRVGGVVKVRNDLRVQSDR